MLVGLRAHQAIKENSIEQTNPLFRNIIWEGHPPTVKTTLSAQAPQLTDLKSRFITASSSNAALVVAHALSCKVAQLLSTSVESLTNHEIDIFVPLLTYGVDSLLGVELRNWLIREFEADIQVFEIMAGASSMVLGVSVVQSSKLRYDK